MNIIIPHIYEQYNKKLDKLKKSWSKSKYYNIEY